MYKRAISATIVAVAIVVFGMLLKAGMDNFTQKDRVVSVKGLAERIVMADRATYPLVLKSASDDINALNNELQDKTNTIKEFCIERGIPEENIDILPIEINDKLLDPYSSDSKTNFRYYGVAVVICSTAKVDRVVELSKNIQELQAKGVVLSQDYRYEPVYEFTSLNDIKPAMIEEATKNARAAAEKFARDSESNIGKIKNATQGQFSIYNRDSYTLHIKTVRVVTTVNFYLKD